MAITLSQCFIAVDDHDAALAFYRDVLGFEVRNDVGFEGMRWVTVGSPAQPDGTRTVVSYHTSPRWSCTSCSVKMSL